MQPDHRAPSDLPLALRTAERADWFVSRLTVFLMLASAALAWDLASKSWVFSSLGFPGGQSDWSWGGPFLWGQFKIQLTTNFNQGALFGIGQGFTLGFAALGIAATTFILYWLFVRGEAKSWWLTLALALITAGTFGNLFDRLYLHGCRDALGRPLFGVRDFLDCTIPWISWGPQGLVWVPAWSWPVFNFADTYLVCGAIALLLQSLFLPQPAPLPIAAADTTQPQVDTAQVDAAQVDVGQQCMTTPTASAPNAPATESTGPIPFGADGRPGIASLRSVSGFPSATGS
jgi:signal peptidase II